MSTTIPLNANQGLATLLADAAFNRRLLVTPGSDDNHCKVVAAPDDVPLGVTQDGVDAAEDAAAFGILGQAVFGRSGKTITASGSGNKYDWLTPADDGSGKARVLPSTVGLYYLIGQAGQDFVDGDDIDVDDIAPRLHAHGYAITADSTTISDTVAKTAFSNGARTVDGPALIAGDRLDVQLLARVSNRNAGDSLTITLDLGDDNLLTIGPVAVAVGDLFAASCTLVVKTGGAAGVVRMISQQAGGVPGTIVPQYARLDDLSVDLSGDLALTVSAQWDNAHADNDVELIQYTISPSRPTL